MSELMLMYARVPMPINKANCIFVLLHILLVRGIRRFSFLFPSSFVLCSVFIMSFFYRGWSVEVEVEVGTVVCLCESVDPTYNFLWQIKNNIYVALASA